MVEELCTIEPHDCLQKDNILKMQQHIEDSNEFRKKIFNGYEEDEIKAVVDFLVSIARVFNFFCKYTFFVVIVILILISSISGYGIPDIISYLKLKNIWIK